ncbi:hypothetical protein HZH68_009760 [Vespula germanica]|uniref:Uncharacterized protein n=1 Tax=Vespula germanica TaxID=30212 RepID=A0A834JX25_VESGE|nr:hypothetical protein HZH68_009760 [Vespula germanica]
MGESASTLSFTPKGRKLAQGHSDDVRDRNLQTVGITVGRIGIFLELRTLIDFSSEFRHCTIVPLYFLITST